VDNACRAHGHHSFAFITGTQILASTEIMSLASTEIESLAMTEIIPLTRTNPTIAYYSQTSIPQFMSRQPLLPYVSHPWVLVTHSLDKPLGEGAPIFLCLPREQTPILVMLGLKRWDDSYSTQWSLCAGHPLVPQWVHIVSHPIPEHDKYRILYSLKYVSRQ